MSRGMLNEKCEIDVSEFKKKLYYVCWGNESDWCHAQKLFLWVPVKIGEECVTVKKPLMKFQKDLKIVFINSYFRSTYYFEIHF